MADGNGGRGEPHLNSSARLTSGAVFPAQAGIAQKSEAFAWKPGCSMGLPWLGEPGWSRTAGLLPSCPRLPCPAWARLFFWGCHQPSCPHQELPEHCEQAGAHRAHQPAAALSRWRRGQERDGQSWQSPRASCIRTSRRDAVLRKVALCWHPGAAQLGTLKTKASKIQPLLGSPFGLVEVI